MKNGMGALVIELGKGKKPEPSEDDVSDEHEAIFKLAEAFGVKRENVDVEAAAEALADWRACCDMMEDDEE